jgi:twitching motility protein PilU
MSVDLRDLVRKCVEANASDLYLKVGAPPTLRVNGVIRQVGSEPLRPADTEALVEQVLLQERYRAIFREKLQVNLAWSDSELGRFRVNVYTQRGTMAMVMRRVILEPPTVAELGLPPILGDLVMERNGLILVTGATGSGKSTTLAAMINHRNNSAPGHIITMEDPIEFLHRDRQCIVSQREIGTDVESFDDAIRDALRQAPDVILIGELRSLDTVMAALHMCETGHLVLGTLHSTNCTLTMERVVDFFPLNERPHLMMLLSLNLRAVISQRLIPRADGNGRVAAHEILIGTARVRDLIRKGELTSLREAMATGNQEGMHTFDQSLYELCKSGMVAEDVAMAFAESPGDLRLRLRGITIGS